MREETFGDLTVRVTGGTDHQGGGAGPAVVLLHGFGAPGTDLVSLGRVIGAPPGTRFVFPEGPLALDPGFGGRAWWMIDVMALQSSILRGELRDRSSMVPEGLSGARANVNAMLDDMERALSPSHLILGGFSQGAMLSCDVALRSERRLDALFLLSGTLLADGEWRPLMPRRRGLPVLVTHGREDHLLPFAMAERLKDALSGAGLAVRWIPFRGGHEIPGAAVDAMSEMLGDVVRTPSPGSVG
jgi:phospholipase/carboxylesterase